MLQPLLNCGQQLRVELGQSLAGIGVVFRRGHDFGNELADERQDVGVDALRADLAFVAAALKDRQDFGDHL